MGKPRSERPDLATVASRDPEVHGGDLVFASARVPVDTLIDNLEGGESVDQCQEDFPTVERGQAQGFVEMQQVPGPRS